MRLGWQEARAAPTQAGFKCIFSLSLFPTLWKIREKYFCFLWIILTCSTTSGVFVEDKDRLSIFKQWGSTLHLHNYYYTKYNKKEKGNILLSNIFNSGVLLRVGTFCLIPCFYVLFFSLHIFILHGLISSKCDLFSDEGVETPNTRNIVLKTYLICIIIQICIIMQIQPMNGKVH